MVTETRDVLDQLAQAPGGQVEVLHWMTKLALQVVSKSLFSKGISEAQMANVDQCVTTLLELTVMKIRDPLRYYRYKLWGKLDAYWAKRRELDALIYGMIDHRMKEGVGDADLMDMLLSAKTDEDGTPLEREEVLQELMTLFLAGHETSANALTWTLMLLDQHPAAKAALQEEVDRVIGKAAPTFQTLHALTYTRQVIDEALRLYPPAWLIGREALGPDQVNELALSKGDTVAIFIYGLHRNPAYWESPHEFLPERMAPDAKKAFPPHLYIPFGGGPRLCIGNQFAITEMQIALAMLIQRFEFARTDEGPISLIPSITLRPGDPLNFRFWER